MNHDEFHDGGQLLVTSTIDDQSCFQLIGELLEGYSDVKSVELVDDNYVIDMSSKMHEKTIICRINYNGQRKILIFGYRQSVTKLNILVSFVIFALLGIFFSIIFTLIIAFAVGFLEYIMVARNLQNRCEQYIRDINNVLMLNEPANNYNTSTTESSDLTINCPSCGVSVSIGMKFCPSCGKEIPSKKFCSHCGTEMNQNMSFCSKCGKKNSH